MEARLLLSPSSPSFPISLFSNSTLVGNPRFPAEKQPLKTSFLGSNLNFGENYRRIDNQFRTRLPFMPVKAIVKRVKVPRFDRVIERDKKLKLVMKIRKILLSQPNRVMNIRDIGRHRNFLGLDRSRRFISLLRKFPAFFEIVEEGAYSLKFKLTLEAENLYMEEMKIRNEMEGLLVIKLRKLLMMSLDKRIPLEKIAHLKSDFGLPYEFHDTICKRYPQYFKLVKSGVGPVLELTHWDPLLAVSAAEVEVEEDGNEDLIFDRPPKFNRVRLPKGLFLSKKETGRLERFTEIPYISPYSDFSTMRSGTLEKEKHACGVVHEILSLTVEKRMLVDTLTHFRDEFRFSQQLRGLFIRHPEMFYVSLKGLRDSVFLKGAYCGSGLIYKDRLLIAKERFRDLVDVKRVINYRNEEGSDDDDYEDVNDALNEIDVQDDDDFEDEMATNEGEILLNLNKHRGAVLPNGRPRDCW